jgi:hypothetical protein
MAVFLEALQHALPTDHASLQCQYPFDFEVSTFTETDYADKWITTAFYNEQTNFENGRGSADFEAILKGHYRNRPERIGVHECTHGRHS